MTIRIGLAGWMAPRDVAGMDGEGSALARYARVFDACEINSTFHRRHQAKTFIRWTSEVPSGFRFSLKLPKTITHHARLIDVDPQVDAFLSECELLGERRGPTLVQLPPSLAFDPGSAEHVFRRLAQGGAPVVCEPRHESWFTGQVDDWMARQGVSRVAADPARHEGAGEPGGFRGLAYWRLHGSPRMYYSAYGVERVTQLAERLARAEASEVWCIFDNTVTGAALHDALALKAALLPGGRHGA